jgi:hypothetical protein
MTDPADDADAGRTKASTFVVTEVDDETAVLRDVHDAEVHTLSAHPDLATHEIVEGTIRAEPPMEVTWVVETVETRRDIEVAESSESPTTQERDIAADQPVGEVTRQERAGEGELHVITVPEGQADGAIADVLDDVETIARAARLGVDRVEVRGDDAVVSVRYMP